MKNNIADEQLAVNHQYCCRYETYEKKYGSSDVTVVIAIHLL